MGILDILRYGGHCSLPIEPGTAALEISNLSFKYAALSALEDINISIGTRRTGGPCRTKRGGESPPLLHLILGSLPGQGGKISIYGNPPPAVVTTGWPSSPNEQA